MLLFNHPHVSCDCMITARGDTSIVELLLGKVHMDPDEQYGKECNAALHLAARAGEASTTLYLLLLLQWFRVKERVTPMNVICTNLPYAVQACDRSPFVSSTEELQPCFTDLSPGYVLY